MTNYQIAKLLLMSDGLPSRKRIQKTVHLLQAAGCSFALDFRLHYYGPYSAELAEQLDRMTAKGMLTQSTHETSVGTQYEYRFNDSLRASLESYEGSEQGQAARDELYKYRPLLLKLNQTRPRVLELASTIVEYHRSGCQWEKAVQETAVFKQERLDSSMMLEAKSFAQKVIDYRNA